MKNLNDFLASDCDSKCTFDIDCKWPSVCKNEECVEDSEDFITTLTCIDTSFQMIMGDTLFYAIGILIHFIHMHLPVLSFPILSPSFPLSLSICSLLPLPYAVFLRSTCTEKKKGSTTWQ